MVGKERKMTRKIALVGVMAALVFAASWIQIPLFAESRLHLGNVMCLLAGFLLGPLTGGVAAGIGSAAFDLTNPLYISSTPFTFAFKFLMAFVSGKVAWRGNNRAENIKVNVLAGILGIVTYIILYLSRNLVVDLYFKNLAIETAMIYLVQKLALSSINGAIAVGVAVPLNQSVSKVLKANNLT